MPGTHAEPFHFLIDAATHAEPFQRFIAVTIHLDLFAALRIAIVRAVMAFTSCAVTVDCGVIVDDAPTVVEFDVAAFPATKARMEARTPTDFDIAACVLSSVILAAATGLARVDKLELALTTNVRAAVTAERATATVMRAMTTPGALIATDFVLAECDDKNVEPVPATDEPRVAADRPTSNARVAAVNARAGTEKPYAFKTLVELAVAVAERTMLDVDLATTTAGDVTLTALVVAETVRSNVRVVAMTVEDRVVTVNARSVTAIEALTVATFDAASDDLAVIDVAAASEEALVTVEIDRAITNARAVMTVGATSNDPAVAANLLELVTAAAFVAEPDVAATT